MYAHLGALSAGFGGFMEGRKQYDQDQARQDEQLTRQWDMMGAAALGKAFAPQGPQPPNPGEASMPAQPSMAQGPMPGGQPPMGAPPMPPQPMAQGPMPGGQPPMGQSPVGGGPPGPAPSQPPPGASPPGGGMPGGGQGGMPQFDLQTLVQRIQAANPNLPPQAMVAAITRATPLLNLQGKIELAQMRAEQRQQAMDIQQGFLDIKRGNTAGGVDGAARVGGISSDREANRKLLEAAGWSEKTLDDAARTYNKTGKMPTNLGTRGIAPLVSGMVREKAAAHLEALGSNPEERAENIQGFNARTAGLRTLETRAATFELAEAEAARLIPRVIEASENVPRTNFPTLNSVIMAAQRGTGDPNVIKLGIAANSLLYVYARVLKPTGVLSEGDVKRASDILNSAWSHGQIEGALDQMQKEIESAKAGLVDAKRSYGASKTPGMANEPAKKSSGGWSVKEIK